MFRIFCVRCASIIGFLTIVAACGLSGNSSSAGSSAELSTSTITRPLLATGGVEVSTTQGAAGDPGSPPLPIDVGAEVALANGFALLHDRRVGVVLNQASVVNGEPLLEVLATNPDVDLVAAFAPEHGVRGTDPAGASIADAIDEATGVPVFSLYGETRSPTPEMLADLDILVFDLQDVGARFYTYGATMGLAMQAAADAGIPFVVFDRPNPLGGAYVDGYVRDGEHESFVGPYPTPAAHGLTMGELALMIKGEAWLPGLDQLELDVVPIEGWSHTTRWSDSERVWSAPSPALTSLASVDVYSGMVLFEATTVSVGRGTPEPFTVVGAPWMDGEALAADLNGRGLPGVRFEATSFVPEAGESVPSPRFEGMAVTGVRLIVEDEPQFRPVATGVHVLEAVGIQAQANGIELIDRAEFFDLLAGTAQLRRGLDDGVPAVEIVASWEADLAEFEALRDPYLLYGP